MQTGHWFISPVRFRKDVVLFSQKGVLHGSIMDYVYRIRSQTPACEGGLGLGDFQKFQIEETTDLTQNSILHSSLKTIARLILPSLLRDSNLLEMKLWFA